MLQSWNLSMTWSVFFGGSQLDFIQRLTWFCHDTQLWNAISCQHRRRQDLKWAPSQPSKRLLLAWPGSVKAIIATARQEGGRGARRQLCVITLENWSADYFLKERPDSFAPSTALQAFLSIERALRELKQVPSDSDHQKDAHAGTRPS